MITMEGISERPDNRSKSERGVALIMALFVLAILSLVGITYMTSSTLETKINSNSRNAYPAFYAAEAGLEEGTYRLMSNAVNPIVLTSVDSPTKVVYIRQSSSIVPTGSSSAYYDIEYAGSDFSTVTYAATNQSTNLMPYQWVKISMKTKRLSGHDVDNTGLTTNQDVPVYYDGAEYLYSPPTINATKMGYCVYQITTFAQSSSGTGYKLRREISSAKFPGMPGAIFFNGPNPTFDAPNSNPYWVIGNDGGGGPDKPAIAVTTDEADTDISSGLPRPTHYIGSGGTTPDVQNVSPSLPSSYTTVQGMEDMVNNIASYANGTYASGTTTCSGAGCWGTAANPKINVFNGDCNLGNGTGYGVLIVRGNFHMQGNGSFYGLILVVGEGTMDFNGGGNGEIQGGIFVAKTRDDSGNLLSNLGSPSIDWNGGGGNGVTYNSAIINQNFTNMGFLKLAYKEMTQ
jgi:Tfp pilus assembly protein PilX